MDTCACLVGRLEMISSHSHLSCKTNTEILGPATTARVRPPQSEVSMKCIHHALFVAWRPRNSPRASVYQHVQPQQAECRSFQLQRCAIPRSMSFLHPHDPLLGAAGRSEERRVGKAGGSRAARSE